MTDLAEKTLSACLCWKLEATDEESKIGSTPMERQPHQ